MAHASSLEDVCALKSSYFRGDLESFFFGPLGQPLEKRGLNLTWVLNSSAVVISCKFENICTTTGAASTVP